MIVLVNKLRSLNLRISLYRARYKRRTLLEYKNIRDLLLSTFLLSIRRIVSIITILKYSNRFNIDFSIPLKIKFSRDILVIPWALIVLRIIDSSRILSFY